jgi:hypothetical protein
MVWVAAFQTPDYQNLDTVKTIGSRENSILGSVRRR